MGPIRFERSQQSADRWCRWSRRWGGCSEWSDTADRPAAYARRNRSRPENRSCGGRGLGGRFRRCARTSIGTYRSLLGSGYFATPTGYCGIAARQSGAEVGCIGVTAQCFGTAEGFVVANGYSSRAAGRVVVTDPGAVASEWGRVTGIRRRARSGRGGSATSRGHGWPGAAGGIGHPGAIGIRNARRDTCRIATAGAASGCGRGAAACGSFAAPSQRGAARRGRVAGEFHRSAGGIDSPGSGSGAIRCRRCATRSYRRSGAEGRRRVQKSTYVPDGWRTLSSTRCSPSMPS